MSSSRLVPVGGNSTGAGSPWTLLRRHGARQVLGDAARRLRCADGFSHARALALLLCLAVVPFLIALTGLADELGFDGGGQVVTRTVVALTPGGSDALVRRLLIGQNQGDTGEVALAVGLLSGVLALTAAMAQIERGANRVYGIRRDRPAVAKYGRALLLTGVAGVPAVCGFVAITAGAPLGGVLAQVYGWTPGQRKVWTVAHLPVAVAVTVLAVATLFRHAPRRAQPPSVRLLPGVLVTTVLWVGASVSLAVYVTTGLFFSDVYGPLAGVVALLLWANASAVALFYGIACCAQLEAYRSADARPCEPDRWATPASRPARRSTVRARSVGARRRARRPAARTGRTRGRR